MRDGRPGIVNTTTTTKQEPAPFGALLVRVRVAAGLTQEQLAARAGLSPAAITDIRDFNQYAIAMHRRAYRMWRNEDVPRETAFQIRSSRREIRDDETESVAMKAQLSGNQVFPGSSRGLRDCVSIRVHLYQLAARNHFLQPTGELLSLIAMQP